MGDPTLRMKYVQPVARVIASISRGSVTLSWLPSPEQGVEEYRVYRASDIEGAFSHEITVDGNTLAYRDANPLPDTAVYMVRAVKRETTTAGTYYNGSTGVFAQLGNDS